MAGVDAVLIDPEPNTFGGNDNCVLVYTLDTEGSLLSAVDEAILQIDQVPEPQIEFLEVHGVPAGRVSGNITAGLIQPIPVQGQVMHVDDWTFLTFCFGSGIDDEIELVLSSFTIL